jgi:hypothetical protein
MAGYVTVHRTYDPLLAEMLGDVLRQEGIDARVLGSQASAIFGAAQSFLQTRIEVPEAFAAHAVELIAAMQPDADSQSTDDTDTPEQLRPPIIAPEVQAPPHLSGMRAVGIAPLIPGGGHFVARRAIVGVAVLLAQAVAVAAMAGGNAKTSTAGALIAVGVLVFDVVGGALAVRAYNRGVRASNLRQLATAAFALLGLGAAGTALAPQVMRLKPLHRAADDSSGDEPALRQGGLTPNDLPFPLRPDPWAGH